ncbi:MAG: hypothetical protein ACREX4_25670, partial [Gammaproteobacteria bacterium]
MALSLDPVFQGVVARVMQDWPEAQVNMLRERLVVVVALPKSSSRAFTKACAHLLPGHLQDRHAKPRQAGWQWGLARSIPINLSLLLDPGMQGIYCTHARYSNVAGALLRELGIKVIVIFRNLLDHLVALGCHWRGQPDMLKRYIEAGMKRMPTAIGHADPRKLLAAHTIDESVRHLIAVGHLFESLSFVAEWLMFAAESDSLALSMEDIHSGPLLYFGSVANYCGARDDSQALDLAVQEYLADFERARASADRAKYPAGWTGSPG